MLYGSDYCNCGNTLHCYCSRLISNTINIFARAKTRKEYRDIYIGQYLGSIILILVSLFLAFVLNYVPEKWILGLLGLIPIYLGIKVAIYDDCEGEKKSKKELNEKGLSKLVGTVSLVTIASCGADNIGLFVPYFVTLDIVELLTTLIVFLVLIFFLVFTAQKLARILVWVKLLRSSVVGLWLLST